MTVVKEELEEQEEEFPTTLAENYQGRPKQAASQKKLAERTGVSPPVEPSHLGLFPKMGLQLFKTREGGLPAATPPSTRYLPFCAASSPTTSPPPVNL